MPENNNKDPMYYRNLIKSLEEIREKIRDNSLTKEQKEEYLFKMVSIMEEIKNINPNFHPQMNYIKSMFMKQIYDKSKKAGDEEWKTKMKMQMGLQLTNEIFQAAEILMRKEQKEFFEKYPELLPINTDEKVDDLNPKWISFRNYYKEKLNNELKKNKYEERSMEKWKREAMVQYLLLKFNEIYRKTGELKVAEEEAIKIYKKLPKTYKKFLKALPKR